MTTPSDLTRPRLPVGSEKLIRAGAASYVQATIAMMQFKEIVLGVCKKLALDRLRDINRIMGTKLTEANLYHNPQRGKLVDPQDPWIYVGFTLKDGASIDIGLYWESRQNDKYQLHAIVDFKFSDQELFQEARRKFDEKRDLKLTTFPYEEEYPQLTLSEAITDEQATVFPETLQTVFERFLVGWEKIGGLKSLKESRSKAR